MALEGSDSVRSQTLRVAQAPNGKGQGEDPAAKQQQAGAGEAAAGGWPQGLNHPGPDAHRQEHLRGGRSLDSHMNACML